MPFATLEEEVEVRCLKHFADIEMQRRRSEHNLRAHNARERGIEDSEQEKVIRQIICDAMWIELVVAGEGGRVREGVGGEGTKGEASGWVARVQAGGRDAHQEE